ncbi:hypothetical protein V6N13_125093 [Hibiscus sabdariffa]|uniref:RRM domain-containing protein n=1 Tax=Hibiscus sabdariffa TaxID=183260 RepID=A0ABR2U4P3_9ROSI
MGELREREDTKTYPDYCFRFESSSTSPLEEFVVRICTIWRSYRCIHPNEKIKTGFRYGFVRFLSLEDAERAILYLNDSVLYGNRLNASLARFADNLEDRKSKQMKNNELRNRETGKNLNIRVGESSSDSWETLMKPRLKRVLGHVDEEALKNLEKCLIGTMAAVCGTSQVEDRLLGHHT